MLLSGKYFFRLNNCIKQINQCNNKTIFDFFLCGVTIRVRLVFCHRSLTCQTQLNHCNTQTHYGFHPRSLTESIRFTALSYSLCSMSRKKKTRTFYRQNKANIDSLLMTHYCMKKKKKKLGGTSRLLRIQHNTSFGELVICL